MEDDVLTFTEGKLPFIVAEVGTSHGGDLKKAYRLIDAVKASGADCAKFQLVFADEIVHPRTGYIKLTGENVNLYDRFKSLERGEEFYASIKSYTEKAGLKFLCTPFGLKSARILKKLGVEAYKIASPELNYRELLEEVASYKKPVILSTGVSKLCDIERAVSITGKNSILLHCVTAYPAPEEEYNVKVITSLSKIFGVPVGISDHSMDPFLVPVMATLEGAVLIEKHFTLTRSGEGLDDSFALEPKDFKAMVEKVRAAHKNPLEAISFLEENYGKRRVSKISGDGVKRLADSEERNYETTNRTIHAVRDIRKGEKITRRNAAALRSEKNLKPGIQPEFFDLIIGKESERDIYSGEGITWEDVLGSYVGMKKEDEVFQLYTADGKETGTARRAECHGNPRLLHGVVHLHLFDEKGRLFLQKRALKKERYPGYWDTSVGGHIRGGEAVEDALEREVEEELGIDSASAEFLYTYIYRDKVESEFVFTYRLVFSGSPEAIQPDLIEIEEGAFFSKGEIEKMVSEGIVTPTFKMEYEKLKKLGAF